MTAKTQDEPTRGLHTNTARFGSRAFAAERPRDAFGGDDAPRAERLASAHG